MMHFSILTPQGELYSAEVDRVVAQGHEGELGILPDHVALVTSLKVAALRVMSQGQESRFAVYGGMLQVTPEKVTVLADQAYLPEQIDQQAALTRKQELESQLNQTGSPEESDALRQELQGVRVQLEVVS